MNEVIVFTHIPKTSGVSLQRELIEPNYLGNELYGYRQFQNFVFDIRKDYKVVSGHVPFGLHRFTSKQVKYITFLRDPIDRAVSFYYFVQQDGENPETRNPLCEYAKSRTLKEFYESKQFQNYQTRFLSGFLGTKFYNVFSTPVLKKWVLKKALYNLEHHYACFGLLEEREKSLQLFQEKFQWSDSKEVPHMKKTRNRPRVKEIDVETLTTLQAANDLDLQLYQFAKQLFRQQYERYCT